MGRLRSSQRIRHSHALGWVAFRLERCLRSTIGLLEVGRRVWPSCRYSPAYHTQNLLFGSHVNTMEGGLLADHRDAEKSLLDELCNWARQAGARSLTVRGDTKLLDDTFSVARPVWPCLALDGGRESIWGALRKKMRYQLRQAQNSTLRVCHSEQIPKDFYTVFSRVQKNLGTPVIPPRTFTAMNRHLSDNLLFTSLWDDNRLVGGMVCIRLQTTLHSLYAATEPLYQKNYANYLMYLRTIEWAAEQNLIRFNMGRSTPGSSAHAFKQKWKPDDHYGVYKRLSFRTTKGVGANKGKSKLLDLTRVWRHLPLPVANTLGPILRKRLPFG